MPFKPGESGNPAGSAAIKPFLAALNRAIAQDDGVKLRRCADNLLEKAAEGEPWAVQMLADRLDGKPRQQTEVTGEIGVKSIVDVLAGLGRSNN